MANISQKSIKELKESVRISDVFEWLGARVVRRGSTAMAWCPFCEDAQSKSPACSLDDDLGLFHCFRCQESGDTITAVQMHEELTFPEAVELMASRFNFTLEYEKSTDPEAESRRKKLIDILLEAQEMFIEQRSDEHFQKFLDERNITMDAAEKFGLGMSLYTRADELILRLQEKFTDEEIVSSGLAYVDEQTGKLVFRFKNRLMFPIRTASGALVGFGGRDLTGRSPAKYKNSPESELFKKRSILYGMDVAKKAMAKSKKAIVCEGYMDTIALQDHGFPYAVGAMGTALSAQNLRKLSTFADTIYISLDSDAAGIAAAMRTAETLPYSFQSDVKVIVIPEVRCDNEEQVRATSLAKADEYLFEIVTAPDGSVSQVPAKFPVMVPMAKDPDEFFNQVGHSAEEFKKIMANAKDLFLFCAEKAIVEQVRELESEIAKDEPDTVKLSQIKRDGRRNIDELMAKIYHKTNVYQRQDIADYVISAMRLLETSDVLQQAWSQRAATSSGAAEAEKARMYSVDPMQEMSIIESDLTGEEDLLIATLYFHPEVRQTVRSNIKDIDTVFTSEVRRSVFYKLDEGYGRGLNAKQSTDELMDQNEVKEIGRIVMGFDAKEEASRELSDDTIIEICERLQKHAIENAIEMESQAANPDVMKIIDLKMQLAQYQ